MSDRVEILRDRDLMYSLTKDKNDHLYLEVLVGGFAMVMLVLPLSDAERRAYENQGKPALDLLAKKMCSDRRAFEARLL